MILKTYGIENLVDWKAQINVGKAKVIVHFTGGAITRYGVTPAEYSTADPMMQHIVECSDYYKRGRIKLMRETEVADDAAAKARKEREAKRAMRKAEDSLDGEAAEHSRLPQEGKGGEYGEAAETQGEPRAPERTNLTATEEGAEQVETQGEDTEENSESDGAGLTEVEVSCLQDAQDYLKENFNVPTTAIRSYEKAQAAAGEHGVIFVGGKF